MHVANHFLSQQYNVKPLTNERTSNKIVDKTFEEIEARIKFIVILDILNKIIERAMQKKIEISRCIVTQVVC